MEPRCQFPKAGISRDFIVQKIVKTLIILFENVITLANLVVALTMGRGDYVLVQKANLFHQLPCAIFYFDKDH